jgi:pimeloyl-ACP methyl ester carboxylesterase
MMERFTQNVGDNMISYLDQGIGHCVVLIHGFCGNHNYWKYIVPHLVKKNRVLTIDLRGHGESSTPRDSYEITEMAEDISILLNSLQINRATIVGHSLGGYIGLAFAEAYPEKLSGLALVHSTAYPDTEEGKVNRDRGIQKITAEGIVPFVNDLIPKLFSDKNVNERKNEIDYVKSIGYKTSDYGAICALDAMKNRPDRNDVLRNLEVPVLLVAGRDDQLIPLDRAFSVEKSTITHTVIEDCGHMSMLEQPDQLVDVLLHYLQTITDSKR